MDLLFLTAEVLESESNYSSALAANIRAFHEALSTKGQLVEHENRLQKIENKLAVNDRIRQEDPPEKKDELLKKRAMWSG